MIPMYVAAAVLALPSAANGGANTVAAPAGDEAIVFYSAGLDGMLTDPKDLGLLSALQLLERRLIELPAELGGPPGVDRAVGTAWDLFTSPMTLQVWSAPAANADAPPLAVQLTATPAGQGAAARLEESLSNSFAMAGLQLNHQGGVRSAATPAGTLSLGTSRPNGQDAVFIGLNSTGDRPAPDLAFDLPGGAKPVIAFRADFHRLQPFLDAMFESAGPESEQLRATLDSAGISGDNAMIIEAAMGFTAEQTVGQARFRGLKKLTNDPDAAAFGKAQLKAIPQDAIWLSIATFDHSEFDRVVEQQEEDPFAALAPMIGVNLRTELVDHIGRRCLAYRADSTGGGGLLSTVFILDLADPAAFGDTLSTLISRFNQLAGQQARGYVRIRSWSQGELALFALLTPGLPLPIEVTWTILGNQLILAGGPSAVIAAVDQVKSGGTSILDNKTFSQAAGSKLDGLASIKYLDTARLAPDGYGMLTLATAALGNAVRSPTDPDRQPGPMLPSYSTLFKNVRPSISIGRWDGDDLVIESKSDRSILVNAAASASSIGGVPVAIAAAAVAAGLANIPAGLEGARQSVQELDGSAEVRQICMGVMMYAADNDDRLPRSLEELGQYVDAGAMHSPLGPAPDGGPDYFLRSDLPERVSQIQRPDATILVIDRAEWLNAHPRISVGFLDGHVEVMSPSDLAAAFKRPENQGIIDALDPR